MALKIEIQTIPHSRQRYETVGDWFFKPDASWQINVSDMADWRYEFLVAVHELIEMALCADHNISPQRVDRFDMEFEANRPEGDISEPGDDTQSPYAAQHCFATGVERLLAAELGVSWKMYETKINEL